MNGIYYIPTLLRSLLGILLFILMISGCGLSNSQVDDENTLDGRKNQTGTGQTESGIASFETNVFPYLQTNCAACHGAGQPPFFAVADVTASYNAAKPIVSFNNPQGSTLVTKAKDGHCGINCLEDGTELANLISLWGSAE